MRFPTGQVVQAVKAVEQKAPQIEHLEDKQLLAITWANEFSTVLGEVPPLRLVGKQVGEPLQLLH
jgi:hypothetical protein